MTVNNDRPIALAALRLDLLCRRDDHKYDKQFYEYAALLFGEKNLTIWEKQGGKEKIRDMLRTNLEVFQDADTSGEGFVKRLCEMYSFGAFVDETGSDFLDAALASDDEEMIGDLADLIMAKMGISAEVTYVCLTSLKKGGR